MANELPVDLIMLSCHQGIVLRISQAYSLGSSFALDVPRESLAHGPVTWYRGTNEVPAKTYRERPALATERSKFSPQHLESEWQVIGAVLRTIVAQGEIV